jgi:hypothetical protein
MGTRVPEGLIVPKKCGQQIAKLARKPNFLKLNLVFKAIEAQNCAS